MRLFIALITTLCLILLFSRAHGTDAPEMPPGVKAEEWIAISKTAGIIVSQHAGLDSGRRQSSERALNGYFVVLQAGVWRPLQWVPSRPQVSPATLGTESESHKH
jgi:hypothetical protein